MARPGLKRELAAAIRQVATNKQETTCRGLQVDLPEGPIYLDLTVKPLLQKLAIRGLMMVVFEETEAGPKSAEGQPKPTTSPRTTRSVRELEAELEHSRESLQTTIEELETSNEELKSTNEELQSTNEELQSTNEEMETSKEELQSLNEESATVNAELQARIDELSNANDDMKNLLDSTEIATLFLDPELRVRRFTPPMTTLFPLTTADVGRPIAHLNSTLLRVDLTEHGRGVLRDLAMRETEVQSEEGRIFTMRVRPYRTVLNVVDGVVVTFDDITKSRNAARERDELAVQYRILFELANDAIVLIDPENHHFLDFNQNAHAELGYTRDEFEQLSMIDLATAAAATGMMQEMQHALECGHTDFRTQHQRKDGSLIEVGVKIKRISLAGKARLLSTWQYGAVIAAGHASEAPTASSKEVRDDTQ